MLGYPIGHQCNLVCNEYTFSVHSYVIVIKLFQFRTVKRYNFGKLVDSSISISIENHSNHQPFYQSSPFLSHEEERDKLQLNLTGENP